MLRPGTLLIFALFLATAGCTGGSPSESPAKGLGERDQTPAKWQVSSSGLRYRMLRKGDGKVPTKSDTVVAHYRGWLDDKTVFDESYPRGEPMTFSLDQVVAGWREGLTYVEEGGEIQLIIPPELAYGNRQTGPIPPNSTLHFTIELLDVK